MSEPRDPSAPSWVLGPGLLAGVLLSLVFAGAGVLVARPAIILLAIPLALTAAWSWDRRPRERRAHPPVVVDLAEHPVDGHLHYSLAFDRQGAEQVRLRLTALRTQTDEFVVSTRAPLRGRIPVAHSGPHEILALEAIALTADGGYFTEPTAPERHERVIAPVPVPLHALPLPRRLTGLTGSHDSTRPGEGGDFRDIHLFAPGDRLQRIDWKVTARRAIRPGELYVRRSAALADATTILVIDSRDDVGENVRSWSGDHTTFEGRTSMDLAREAASSLAAATIQAGDRVGLRDLATQHRAVPHGAGRRHLDRLLRAIALAQPAGAPQRRRRAPLVVAGALICVLSTFLDDEATRMAARWRAAGHRVIAVDVLPRPDTSSLERELALAYRIVMMEREERIRGLQAAGVELLTWQPGSEAGDAAAQLRVLSRPARRAG